MTNHVQLIFSPNTTLHSDNDLIRWRKGSRPSHRKKAKKILVLEQDNEDVVAID